MPEMQALVSAIMDHAHGRGATCEVWLEDRTSIEVRAAAGGICHVSERSTLVASVTTWRDGHEGSAVAMGPDALIHAVDAALASGAVLAPRLRSPRPLDRTSAGRVHVDDSDEPQGADGRLAAASRLVALTELSDLVRDATLDEHCAVVGFGRTDSVYLERRTRRSVVQLRTGDGRDRGALSRSFVSAGQDEALTAAELAAPACLAQTAVLGGTVSTAALPHRVVLHGSVMSRLLSLLAPSLQQDSVAEGRSRLADRVGARVAAPGFSLIDDAPGQGFAFDDEGTPARLTRLIENGVLMTFLSDVRSAAAVGTRSTAAGWRSSAGREVQVRPAALLAGWGGGEAPWSGPALHVLSATGMHISNDVTGAFSFGATGLVGDGSGSWVNAGSFTVAGNVIDLLERLYPVHSSRRFVPRSVGLYASPDMGARGLVIGR